MISRDYFATIRWFRPVAAEMFESQATCGDRLGRSIPPPGATIYVIVCEPQAI